MMLVACVRALNLLPPKLFCRKIDYLRRHAIICANGFRDGLRLSIRRERRSNNTNQNRNCRFPGIGKWIFHCTTSPAIR
jgi:hypothetical protein